MHPIKTDSAHRGIGSLPGTREILSPTRHRHHPSAGHFDSTPFGFRSGMKNGGIRHLFAKTDLLSQNRLNGIPRSRQHHGHRRPGPAFYRKPTQIPIRRRSQQIPKWGLEQRQQNFRLGITKPGIELQNFRPVLGQHQPRIKHPTIFDLPFG